MAEKLVPRSPIHFITNKNKKVVVFSDTPMVLEIYYA